MILVLAVVLRRAPERRSSKWKAAKELIKHRLMKDGVDAALPEKCCQSKKAQHYPTSCLGLAPERSAANVEQHQRREGRVRTHAYARTRAAIRRQMKPIPYKPGPKLQALLQTKHSADARVDKLFMVRGCGAAKRSAMQHDRVK